MEGDLASLARRDHLELQLIANWTANLVEAIGVLESAPLAATSSNWLNLIVFGWATLRRRWTHELLMITGNP